MAKFDLNDARDFQRLTIGAAGSVLQSLDAVGRDPNEWDIQEASFRGVYFHVFKTKTDPVYQAGLSQIVDSGGRRKVKYKYPYRDGQTTDDLGREAFTFQVEALLHGDRYLAGLRKLIDAINNPTPGTLVHPVIGSFDCVVESYQLTHVHSQRKAVSLNITFIEHSYDMGKLKDFKDKSVKTFLSKCLEALSFIDQVVTNVLGVAIFARSLKNQINTALTEYKERFGNSLISINKSFNSRGSSDFPNLLPVNEGGQSTAIFEVSSSPNDRYKNVSLGQENSPALAVDDVTKKVIKTREQLNVAINLIETGANGLGSLEFYEDIVSLKEGAILLQQALETGIASSRAQVIEYKTPRIMSIREVAFANGIDVERVIEIDLLNPFLLSVNCIPAETIVRVPIA